MRYQHEIVGDAFYWHSLYSVANLLFEQLNKLKSNNTS